MRTSDILHVWLRGDHLGELEQLRNGRLRLRYTHDVVGRWGEGACPLSLSLPVSARRVEGQQLEEFIDGLLPEGSLREQLVREFRTRTPFDLLARIGVECAGAVQFTREAERPGAGRLRRLDHDEVTRLVSALPSLDPPEGESPTASLGGIQAKLLLTRTDDGWAWPVDGAPSTHIIKPQSATVGGPEHLVLAEHWAMRVAARAGVAAATTELERFDDRAAIVIERFDRIEGIRVHQEDFAQALGIPTRSKYEYQPVGEPRLRRIAASGSQNALSPRVFLDTLLRQVTFNAAIGNGDAHSKNYSLTIDAAALYSPAPLYDVAPVMFLGPYRHSGHAVDGLTDLRFLTRRNLVAEGVAWGLRQRQAEEVVESVIESTRNAVASTEPPMELRWLPDRVGARIAGFDEGR